ncbi:MAG: undecaprenyl-diphosphate phosphatase [Coriobacteriales bacterium]|nr:undecaprenyl-diphosphate phosphatase [Coriobacteriales bacterium]
MDFIELLKAVVIGLVEGVTEWLPVSSTGHMIIVDDFITLHVSEAFWSLFLVVIQLGAILAVIILYFRRLNPFSPRKSLVQRRTTLRLWAKVLVACVPAAVIGLLFDDWFEEHFFNAFTVAVALVAYGVAFIVIERIKAPAGRSPARVRGAHARAPRAGAGAGVDGRGSDPVGDVDRLGFGRALCVGLFQCLAIVPGTSRSGSTILGGRILGISREAAAEFSFFLAIPVMFGWSLLKLVRAFLLDQIVLTPTEWGVFAVGIIVAFAVSVVAIKFLMGYIRQHSFEAFGWYRIVLGAVVLGYFLITGQFV